MTNLNVRLIKAGFIQSRIAFIETFCEQHYEIGSVVIKQKHLDDSVLTRAILSLSCYSMLLNWTAFNP